MDHKVVETEVNDNTVKGFIHGKTSPSPPKSPKEAETRNRLYSPDDDEFLEIPSSAGLPPRIHWRDEGLFHGQESYSSFGEKGTTASVNAYGRILQISRYLGVGSSGIFCADPCLVEPYVTDYRMKELLSLSTDAKGGFGLCLNPELASSKPQLQFLHGRWPRYTHSIGDLSVSIQYFANRGVVIQQYLFQSTEKHEVNNGTEGSNAHSSRGVDDDVSPNLHEDEAVRNQAGVTQAQGNRVQNDRNRNQPSPENCAREDQREHSLPQNETRNDEILCNTHKKTSIKDCLRLESSLQIRESESANFWNRFNMEFPDGAGYHTTTGQNQYSLMVSHQIPATGEAVGLVIAVFVNGHATKIQYNRGTGTYEIDFDPKHVSEFENRLNTSLEITVAYRLRRMKKDSSWQSTLIPASVLNLSDLMARRSYDRSLPLSKSEHFNFILNRNLEHVLSVCSIPVSDTPIEDDDSDEGDVSERPARESQTRAEGLGGGSPIALTCGDIAGHYVLVSASFFAFEFLLAVYSYIEGKHYDELEKRILETLKGHLEWVFRHVRTDPDDRSPFFARYWANGQRQLFGGERNPQHTSFQIIKARDFASKFQRSGEIPSWFVDEISDFMEKWIGSLRKSDNRDYCVFHRLSESDEEAGYYLRDHVLIWKALGIIEVLENLDMNTLQDLGSHLANRRERQIALGVYTSNQARKRILKRFTTQNALADERMFATYRDPQDNSFFLDPMDTILFYDEQEFFRDSSREISYSQQRGGRKVVLDEWIRTLDVQTLHKRTDDKDWKEPLQYALAIQMAKYGHPIDSRPVNDVFDGALKMLLQSCSTSGIFPGFVTRDLKLPTTFDLEMARLVPDLDSYWHTSFELPYTLWMYAKERLEETSGQDKKQAPLEKSAASGPRKTNKQPQSQMGQFIHEESFMPKFFRAKTVLGGQDFTDQKNVFEISDEWLVPCPEFLHFDPKCSFTDLLATTTEGKISVTEFRRLVIDIPKRKNQMDDQTPVDPQPRTSEEFFERLKQWRTKKENMLIKKRLIWLSSGDKEAAAICPTAVPESEQLALTGFFGRHNNRDKYFLDDPSVSNNSWKTEFQLSFYQLEKQGNSAQSKPEIALAKRIRRASMGFRFNGDFFDCYWTCHIINFGDWMGRKESQGTEVGESTQEVEKLLNDFLSRKVGSPGLAFPQNGPQKRAWHQRKVIELILFEEIIKKVTAGTQDILREIKNVLDSTNLSGPEENETIKDLPDKVKETVLFSKIDGNAYFSFSSQWEVIQQLLQVLDEDLNDTVKKIANWQDREKNRGTEKPRWTKKDEKRYRPALRRMQLSNAESVRGLLQLQEKAQSLRSSLISRRDYIRDDLNLRGAENTRYFTYVTVVFLPLGFATGIFSMSETPAGATLARMSGTAAITFLLTVLALYFVVELIEAYKRLRAILIEELARVEDGLQRILLSFYIAYVLWRALGGSMRNFFNNQEIPHQGDPSLQRPNEASTGRKESTAALPEGILQDQPARQRRPASFSGLPGDLENQIGPRHSFG